MSTVAKFITSLSFLFVLGIFITSCGDDAIKGCTDQEAENYNPDADESDGNCEYASDKFIGDYEGTLGCMGELADVVSPDSIYEFKILPTLDETDSNNIVEVTVNLVINNPLTMQDVPAIIVFPATITGSNLKVENYEANIAGIGATISADMNMSSDNKTLSGPLSISSVLFGSDTCNLLGMKI